MEKLIVLDFRSGEVTVYDYDFLKYEDVEDFQDKYGRYVIHNDCQYMVVKELKINIE
jgi:hypothetical protein